ncbi:hypothetical protein [Nocardioides sp. KR10-350]|uniref:hypothetical protein n=1 Tax=Nocardioides cheoyonin TaxID=3156615 RepID=UPI0032B3E5BE
MFKRFHRQAKPSGRLLARLADALTTVFRQDAGVVRTPEDGVLVLACELEFLEIEPMHRHLGGLST